MRNTTENLSALQSRMNDLQLENQVLKQLLEQNGISYRREIQALHAPEKLEKYETNQGARIRHPQMITDVMANHFYARFWGRQDVYSKRSENKKGEAGYYPQCHNFWRENCPKAHGEKISCGSCPARDYKRLQKEDILAHLRGYSSNGSDVIGVYPLLPNGTCRFLVYDFDNHEKGAEKRDFANSDESWIEEVEAMRTICVLNGLDPLVERSRSGRGAHIWLFFDKPISARLVRAFGNALLDRGAEQVNLKSFRYYDRMLPAQEEVPEGGLGNLIALPLQGRELREGNSAFVDENWNAYPDQWKVLWSKPRLSEEFLQSKLKEWAAERPEDVLEERLTDVPADREKPWKWKREFSPQDIAGTLSITLADGIYVDTLNLKPAMQNRIRRLAAVSNPGFYRNQAIGISNYFVGRWIYLGPVRYQYTAKDKAKAQGIAHFVYPRFTRAVVPRWTDGERMHPNEAYEIIRNHDVRDDQIIEDVKACVEAGRTPIVLSRYKDHSEKLYQRLMEYADHVFLLTGNHSKREHRAIREQMQAVGPEESLILVATGSLVGEGFDFPRLDTLIMATPVSFRSVIEQYAGRLNRDYPGKRQVIIYDYIDSHIPMFRKMYMKRLKAYKQIGYEICGDLKSESQISEKRILGNQVFAGQKTNTIFDGGNYQETLKADLLSAAKNIIISSPAISGQKVYEFIDLLKERQETGVDVTIVTWAPDFYGYGEPSYWMQLHEDMRQAGFFVKTAEEFCDRFAVIDQDLVWYGSMNLLAKEQIEDSMLRVHGKEIAAELLETALGRRGERAGGKITPDTK